MDITKGRCLPLGWFCPGKTAPDHREALSGIRPRPRDQQKAPDTVIRKEQQLFVTWSLQRICLAVNECQAVIVGTMFFVGNFGMGEI